MATNDTVKSKFTGCLLGLALGDALGAPFEGGILERLLWRLIGRTGDGKIRWTDDTQMSLDVAESLIANGKVDADDLAKRFARSYRWSRGYGPGAAKILKRIKRGTDWQTACRSVYPEGSFGNGGAMRAPVVGLFYANLPEELVTATHLSASVTHAHPLGIEGAVLIAIATATSLTTDDPIEILDAAEAACTEPAHKEKLQIAREWLTTGIPVEIKEVRQKLGNGIAANESTVTALFVALSFLDRPFVNLLDFIRKLGGDVDTIGAMAGAIWGAVNSSDTLPKTALEQLEQSDQILKLAGELYDKRRP